MLSPAQERQFWLDKLKGYEFGMAVNCRHMPSLSRTPILKQLIKDGLVVRRREGRWGMNSNRTVIYLPEIWEARVRARSPQK
ncbi:hypothetical protein [Pseudomonas phage REC1]|nr:hypothetical protein [Pseudomonas phage REC1]